MGLLGDRDVPVGEGLEGQLGCLVGDAVQALRVLGGSRRRDREGQTVRKGVSHTAGQVVHRKSSGIVLEHILSLATFIYKTGGNKRP